MARNSDIRDLAGSMPATILESKAKDKTSSMDNRQLMLGNRFPTRPTSHVRHLTSPFVGLMIRQTYDTGTFSFFSSFGGLNMGTLGNGPPEKNVQSNCNSSA